VLSSVAEGCDAIPSRLREAARTAAKIKDRKAETAGLASAAVEVLGPACEIPEPRGSAAELTTLCPLTPSDLPIEGAALVHMRAADWGFLHQSLNRAQAYDERARRLLLIFALSSAILGEEETQRAPAR
jgi:hypothetical protein